MQLKQNRRNAAIEKELQVVCRQESKIAQAAINAKQAAWKMELESRVPQKVYSGLEEAFQKGFFMVFEQGRGIIEKGYNKDSLREDYAVRDFAVQVKGRRKELKQMQKSARHSDRINLAVTAVEGVALGALGIGMPDVVLFLGTLLKGVYEAALNYGFDYESPQERLLILKMLDASLSCGDEWIRKNEDIEKMILGELADVSEDDITLQIRSTASVFALDMLLLKLIQGLPVVGILGGAANPVYYRRVMKYVQLKYRKRYLLKQKNACNGKET